MRSENRVNRMLTALSLLVACSSASAQSPWSDSYRLEAEGDFRGAIGALGPVFDADSDHEFATIRRAWLEYQNGDYNAAIRYYRRALNLNAQSLEASLGLALPLLAQRRWREAAATAQQVLAVAPWNYYAHVRLMAAEEGLQRWQTLAEHAAEAALRFPTDATILVYLARAEAARGNRVAAAEAYSAVLERFPDHAEAQSFLGGITR